MYRLRSHLVSPFIVVFIISMSLSAATDEPESSTVNYERAHEFALAAFEVLSPLSSDGGGSTEKYVANEILDSALERIREKVDREKLDRYPIPNFQESFKKDFGFFSVDGSFRGIDGWVGSLLSIVRRGDAIAHVDNTSLVLDTTLGLNTLNIGMKFVAKLGPFPDVKGDITGRVRSNTVMLSNALDYSTEKCKLKVRSLKITELGKIDTEVTGLGSLDWLSSQIAAWITDRSHQRIHDLVEKLLGDELQKQMDTAECPELV